MKSVKILMINDYGSKVGGDLTYVLNLKAALEKRNHIVKLLSSDIILWDKHFGDYKFRSFRHDSVSRALYYIFNPFSLLKLREALGDFKPDIIHIHNIYYQVSPSILALLKKYPTVMTTHSYELVCPKNFMHSPLELKNLDKTSLGDNCCNHTGVEYYYYKFRSVVYKRLCRNIDIFVSVSNYVERVLKNGSKKTIQVIHNGIKLLEYSKMGSGENLLYVGRLSREKGIEYLLKAMPLITKAMPRAHLYIAGDGDQQYKLEDLSKELNITKSVTFLGPVPFKEIKNHYNKANILIVPSLWKEPFGLVGPEAMSVGRPVVASNVGGIPEWLDDGVNGFLVEPGNSKQIAEKVIRLFSDRKLLEKMGENARKKAEQFSIEKHVIKIENIYEKLVDKYKSKRYQ